MKIRLVTQLLVLSAVAHAAPAQSLRHRTLDAAAAPPANSVTVQNDRKVPVEVFMDYGEFDRRLGTVGAMQTATLPLPTWATEGHESIRLFAHPEGEADDLESRWFSLKPPARLALMIPPFGAAVATPKHEMKAVIPPEELADATLTVDNPRAEPVTIYAEREDMNMEVRLGQVPAHGRATLEFPKSVVYPDRSIQIVVHPEKGFDLESQTMQLKAGQHLGLRVPPR